MDAVICPGNVQILKKKVFFFLKFVPMLCYNGSRVLFVSFGSGFSPNYFEKGTWIVFVFNGSIALFVFLPLTYCWKFIPRFFFGKFWKKNYWGAFFTLQNSKILCSSKVMRGNVKVAHILNDDVIHTSLNQRVYGFRISDGT